MVLLTVMGIINPPRALLIPFSLFSAFGSWFAWKLGDFCKWIGGKVNYAKEHFWLVGKPLQAKIKVEMEELNHGVAAVEKRLKEDNDV